MSDLILRKNQVPHFERICSIISKYHSYLDTSPTGTGKMIIVIKLAKEYGLPILVFAPLSVLSIWEIEAKKYGVPLIDSLTYQKLVINKSHEYLFRLPNKEKLYAPTEQLKTLIREGVLIVFDEMHCLKNETTLQHIACHAIVKEVVRINSSSRIALLSATPCDKEEHAESLVKMLGIVTNNLYEYDKKKKSYNLLGITELFNRCSSLDPKRLDEIKEEIGLKNGNQNQLASISTTKLVYDLYTNIIKFHQSSSMERNDNIPKQEIKNGYFTMPESDLKIMRHGEALLRSTVHFDELKNTIIYPKGNWGDIVSALTLLEKSKINTMIPRLVEEDLSRNQKNKGIIFVWRKESIDSLRKTLERFNPLILCGDTKPNERIAIIEKFQKPSNENRLIIANAKVGGVGLSLDDIDGNWPRTTWIIPSYDFIQLCQAPGRTCREMSKSKSKVWFVYSKEFKGEMKILESLTKKSEITKGVIYNSDSAIFPSDYSDFVEQ